MKLTIGRTLLLLAIAAVPMALALAAESKEDAEREDASPLKALSSVVLPPAPVENKAEPVDFGEPPSLPALKPLPPRKPAQVAEAPPEAAGATPPSNVLGLRYDDQLKSANAQQSLPAFDDGRVAQSYGAVPAGPTYDVTTSATARKRAIFRLNNAPALDVAETIRTLYDGEMKANPGSKTPDVVISSDAVSNCLLVSASEDDLAQIEEFIKTLDAPKSMVRVEMLIAQVGSFDSEEDGKKVRERLLGLGESGGVDSEEFGKQIAELREQKVLTILSRPQIMTLDNQPAFVQVGEALVGKPDDGPVPGVTVGLTPRIAENLVLMEVDVEITRAESAGKAVVTKGSETAEDTLVPMRRMVTTTVQTTTSVADGRTVILGGLTSGGDTQGEDLIVVLTPHIVTQGPRPVARRRQAEPLDPMKGGNGWRTYPLPTTTTQAQPAPFDTNQAVSLADPQQAVGGTSSRAVPAGTLLPQPAN